MIKDTNVLSAFELNEKNLQFLKELRNLFVFDFFFTDIVILSGVIM